MEDNLNIEELQAEIEARRREIDTRRREIARILYRGDYGNANWEAEYDARVQENPHSPEPRTLSAPQRLD